VSALLSPASTKYAGAKPTSNSSVPSNVRDEVLGLWDWVARFEWLIVILVALAAALLHFQFVTHVGGLWRDEANSVNVATLPTFGAVWHFLEYDSFPILFFALLRGWTGIFGAENDAALRALGLLIGLGMLGAVWTNARAFGVRWPVLSLTLIGLNPMLIRYGDSTRAYGLGILLILLTLRSFWRLVNSPAPPPYGRVVAATGLALLSVQCLYYNSVLLLAIAAGAVAVAVRKHSWRTAGIILLIGILAAASLLPYGPMIRRMHEWTFLVTFPVDIAWLWTRLRDVIGSPNPLVTWLWVSLFVLSFGVVVSVAAAGLREGFVRWRISRSTEAFLGCRRLFAPPHLPDAVLFAAVALAAGVVGYAAFLKALSYCTQPWYYITLAAFGAGTLEVLFGAWPTTGLSNVLSGLLRGVRLTAAVLLLCLGAPAAWKEIPTRHTNVDLLAATLKPLTTKDDLIVVPIWEYAITVCRYYHGPAPVVSLPPIEDHRFHRYDLVLREMTNPDSLHPVFVRMEEVLRSGHHVFVAGMLPFPSVDIPSPPLPLARDASGHWYNGSYRKFWQVPAGRFLRAHARGVSQIEVPVPDQDHVQESEYLPLLVLEGWNE
jgi:hypothetical protein